MTLCDDDDIDDEEKTPYVYHLQYFPSSFFCAECITLCKQQQQQRLCMSMGTKAILTTHMYTNVQNANKQKNISINSSNSFQHQQFRQAKILWSCHSLPLARKVNHKSLAVLANNRNAYIKHTQARKTIKRFRSFISLFLNSWKNRERKKLKKTLNV